MPIALTTAFSISLNLWYLILSVLSTGPAAVEGKAQGAGEKGVFLDFFES